MQDVRLAGKHVTNRRPNRSVCPYRNAQVKLSARNAFRIRMRPVFCRKPELLKPREVRLLSAERRRKNEICHAHSVAYMPRKQKRLFVRELFGNHIFHHGKKFVLKKSRRVRTIVARVAQEQVCGVNLQRIGNFQDQLERRRRLARFNPADVSL